MTSSSSTGAGTPASSLSLRQRLLRGAQAQVAAHAVRVIIQVAGVSLLISSWGLDRYGDWLILAAIPNYIAFSDIGFVGAAMNEMIMAVGREDRTRAVEVFKAVSSALLGLFVIVAVAVPLVGLLVPVASLLNLGTLTNAAARWILVMLAADALLEVYAGLFYGGFAAEGRYGEGSLWMTGLLLAEFCGLAAAVVLGGGPALGAGAMLGVRAAGTVVMYLAMRHRVPWLRLGRPAAIRPVLRRLISPALASGAIPAALILNIQGMVVLVGVTLGPAAAAVFSTVRTLSRALNQLLASVFAVITPEISRAYARRDNELVRRLHRRGCQLAIWLALPPAIVLAAFGGPILKLWTSGKVDPSGLLLDIFLVGVVVDALWTTSLGVLYATNQHQRVAAYYFAGSLISVAVAYPLIEAWGLDGAALAVLLLELFMPFPVLRQALPVAHDNLRGLIAAIVRPPIAAGSMLAALRALRAQVLRP
jgi:O-antigen/teichoic acid export membrane protein